MMLKKLGAIIALSLLTGCATTGFTGDTGIALVHLADEAGQVTSVSEASKKGKACTHNILGAVAFGDATIEKAKKNGEITKVSSVDKGFLNILGFYGRACTIVSGS